MKLIFYTRLNITPHKLISIARFIEAINQPTGLMFFFGKDINIVKEKYALNSNNVFCLR